MTQANLNVSWRTVAIGSLLINLGTIGTLATVISLHDANTLASVALALAIIAFICQLIIFSVQTWQSGEQLKQAERLNSQTSSLLAEARTRLEGTHQMVTSQYEELLHLTALRAATQSTKLAAEAGEDEGTVQPAPISASTLASLAEQVVKKLKSRQIARPFLQAQ